MIVGWQSMQRPDKPEPPPQFSPSCAGLGIVAQEGRLIELRAPNPSAANNMRDWQRIYLTPDAAKTLLEWLPAAVSYALTGSEHVVEDG